MNYIGESCVVCSRIFNENDDVVVCPQCGAPHHRGCYKDIGHCACTDSLHASGIKWQRTVPDPEPEPVKPAKPVICPVCGEECGAEDEECPNCSAPLGNNGDDDDSGVRIAQETVADYLSSLASDEDAGGATMREISQFVNSNKLYYLPVFKRIKDTGIKASMNIIAFFFPPIYFANRRMWGWAVITALISAVLAVPAAINFLLSDGTANNYVPFTEALMNLLYDNSYIFTCTVGICNSFQLLLRIIMFLFADYMYMRYSIRTINKLKRVLKKDKLSAEILAAAGGVRPVNTLLILAIFAAMSYLLFVGASVLLEVLAMFSR